MRDPVLAALRSKLVTYESAGLVDLAKRVKARIAKLEKAAEPKAPAPASAKSELAKPSTSTVDGSAASKKLKES